MLQPIHIGGHFKMCFCIQESNIIIETLEDKIV